MTESKGDIQTLDIPQIEIVTETSLEAEIITLLRKHGELATVQITPVVRRPMTTVAGALRRLEASGTVKSRKVMIKINGVTRHSRLYKLAKRK